MNATPPVERREVFYRGRVQGVGFRAITREIALVFRVSGRVENLSDGRVKVVVEGEAGELDRFQSALAARMCDHIREVIQTRQSPTGEYVDFRIEH